MEEARDSLSRQDESMPSGKTLPSVTTMTVRLHPGRSEQLDYKLKEICQQQKHLLPGTTERYIMQNMHNPEEIHILLIWQSGVRPREQGRILRAFFADLDEILDWQTASGQDYTMMFEA